MLTSSLNNSIMMANLMIKMFDICINDLKKKEGFHNEVKIILNPPQECKSKNKIKMEELSLCEKIDKRKMITDEKKFSISIENHFISKYFLCLRPNYKR